MSLYYTYRCKTSVFGAEGILPHVDSDSPTAAKLKCGPLRPHSANQQWTSLTRDTRNSERVLSEYKEE